MERSSRILCAVALALSTLLGTIEVESARADDCRDETGEPAPCAPSLPEPAAVSPTAPPSIAPTEPSTPSERAPDVTASVVFDFGGESLDLRPLQLTPSAPEDVADLARDTTVTGATAPFDVPGVTFGVSLAARPLSWLEIPTLRVAWGVGELGATVPLEQRTRSAELGTLVYVRLEIGAGIDVPIGDAISIFARTHIAMAGYFVSARVVDEALGSLGRTWLAEDAWELGWTLGASVRVDRSAAWVFSYRHVHTGAESNVLSLGMRVDIR